MSTPTTPAPTNGPVKGAPAVPSGEAGRDAIAPAGPPSVTESAAVPTPPAGADAITPGASTEGQGVQQAEAQAAVAGAPVVEAKPIDPEEQARIDKREALVESWKGKLKKPDGTIDPAKEASFAETLAIIDNPDSTPEEIIAAQEELGIFDPQMREYLDGDPRAGMVAREKTKRVIVSVQEWMDQSAEQATQQLEAELAQDDTLPQGEKDEKRAALTEHVRESRAWAEKELIEPRRNLFSGDASERMEAAVALAKLKMADPTVSEMSLQEYFSQHFGYNDSEHFFNDVEKLIPLREELQDAQVGENDSVEPVPAGTPEEKVAEEPEQPEAGPVVTAEDSGLLATLEEGRRVASDPTATQEQRTAAAGKLTGELAKKHKRDTADKKRKLVTRTKKGAMIVGIPLAAAVIVVLMMLSLNSIGGGK